MNQVNMNKINQKIQKLIEKYRTIEVQNKNNLETISKLEQVVSEKTNEITNLNDNLENKELQIMTHEDTIKDLNQNIEFLNSQKNELESKVSELQSALESIGNNVDEIDSKLSDMFPDIDLSDIDEI